MKRKVNKGKEKYKMEPWLELAVLFGRDFEGESWKEHWNQIGDSPFLTGFFHLYKNYDGFSVYKFEDFCY